MKNRGKKTGLLPEMSRRSFLKIASVAAGASAFVAGSRETLAQTVDYPGDTLDSDTNVSVLYTVCQMCHSKCGVKAKIENGVLIKTDGNPYSPTNASWNDGTHASRLAFTTDPSLASTKAFRGRMCAKAQSNPEMIYSPTRLTTPLKRVGKRGEGKWVSLTWDEAINEIVNMNDGGSGPTVSLTSSSGGTYTPRGMKTIYNDSNDISSYDPALGKKKNGILFSPGRHPHGNKEFTDHLFKKVLGTANYRLDHTSICETSHHQAFKLQTAESRAYSKSGTEGFGPDLVNNRFLCLVGENPAEANFSHQGYARYLADALKRASDPSELWVVDPRLSRTAAIAQQNGGKWLAVKPGYDGAMAMGVIRSMIDGVLYNASYLENTNRAAAIADSEYSFTDATYLVRRDNGELLDAADLAAPGTSGNYVCIQKGTSTAVEVDPDNTSTALEGELFESGVTVNSIVCDSVFSLLKAEADKNTVAQWATLCGLAESDLSGLATKMGRSDRKAALISYRGACQHTNGVYNVFALNSINWMIGNVDRKGGQGKADHWHESGGKTGQPTQYKLSDNANFNGTFVSPTGPRIDRTSSNIDDYSTFHTAGPDVGAYPTKRPWFPFAGAGNYQELFPSIGDQYPYAAELLFSLWNVWPYSTPAGYHCIDLIKDTTKLPLHVAFDVQLGELTAMADYVLPDATFLEIYATPHGAGSTRPKYSGLRHPVVGEFWDAANNKYVPVGDWAGSICANLQASRFAGANAATPVWGTNPYYRPAVPNARTHYDIFLHMFVGTNGISPSNNATTGLPAVGINAWKTAAQTGGTSAGFEQNDSDVDLTTAWDWFKRMAANIALEDTKVVTGGTDTQNADYVLARGGRFEDGDAASGSGNYLDHTHGSSSSPVMFHFYVEKLAKEINSMTGNKDYHPLATFVEQADALGNTVKDSGYSFQVITYKLSWHGQGRTVVNPSLMSLWPENWVIMNKDDCDSLSIKKGDTVWLTSISNSKGVTGKAHPTYGIRKGVVAVSHHFGHWELGTKAHVVDGTVTAFDERRGAGLSINPIIRVDSSLNTKSNAALYKVAIQDLVGGSVSYHDTWINVTKVP